MNQTYDKIADAIDILVQNTSDRAYTLDDLARRYDCAPETFQKQFSAYVGVSPSLFQRYLKLQRAKDFLLACYPTLEAAYAAGLSGNGRLHSLCVGIEAATPGEIKSRGAGVRITYGWIPSPFGQVLIGQSARGICWLAFAYEGNQSVSEEKMRSRFSGASFRHDPEALRGHGRALKDLYHGARAVGTSKPPIRLHLFGTNFQLKVWEALLNIPTGGCMSYGALAACLGAHKASRAVGGAVGANPISFIIPCHRVIQQSGIVHNYAWGSARKKGILGLEGHPKDELA